jgi:hypothetical protein
MTLIGKIGNRDIGASGNRGIGQARIGTTEDTEGHGEVKNGGFPIPAILAIPWIQLLASNMEAGIEKPGRGGREIGIGLPRELPDAAWSGERLSGSFHSRSLARLVRGRSG